MNIISLETKQFHISAGQYWEIVLHDAATYRPGYLPSHCIILYNKSMVLAKKSFLKVNILAIDGLEELSNPIY
jgi:hypothetical protein